MPSGLVVQQAAQVAQQVVVAEIAGAVGQVERVIEIGGIGTLVMLDDGLGFVEGNEIHVVSSSGANIIVTVLGARFGIDSKVAMHIMTVG